ncbi:PleD family two-component system response regulator [Dyadobacter subterraneus]|uniref:Response regulator n=1 Tax=Dyadobacter subterraneus TaxID=2773304 RepID=A0ABR9WMR0_9BACT|nr:response regulator [Dyadobacter subterraneus]MBE9466668.1 response regulator [Dyadobacter subterraneus]
MKSNTTYSIAIVDHNLMARAFIRRLLVDYHFTIAFEAENGQDCVDKMLRAQIPPALIILDIETPIMDGFQTACILRTNWPFIKIIAFSSKNDTQTIDKIMAAGADFFLPKQNEIYADLIITINSVLNEP